jgi:hypothetical protein
VAREQREHLTLDVARLLDVLAVRVVEQEPTNDAERRARSGGERKSSCGI